jgi:adenylate kinase family enzyme
LQRLTLEAINFLRGFMQQLVPKRIAIIGLPGSGKSTWAVKVGKILDVPVHHLDKHMFTSNRQKINKSEFIELLKILVESESWVIEGCSFSTFEMRFARADTVLYFNFSRPLCIWRIFKRFVKPDTSLKDHADGNSQFFNLKMIRYIWNFNKEKGKRIEELRQTYKHIDFRMIKNLKELELYFRELQEKMLRSS